MSFFKRLSRLFALPSQGSETSYPIVVKCRRCGELLQTRVNLRNDLSVNYGKREADTTYFCRKLLIGDTGCFQRIEVELTFDADHKLVERQINGGEFID